MSERREADRGSESTAARAFTPLLASAAPLTAAEIVEELGLWERPRAAPAQPLVTLNMIASADGRATLAGRSGGLGDSADRELFHALRAASDAVLVGAATVRAERYGRLIPVRAHRLLRRERGLAEEPLACIVSASLALGAEIPLLGETDAHVAILTPSAGTLAADLPARVEYVRGEGGAPLDLRRALAELSARFGVTRVLCEGGPHLAAQLLCAGLVEELFLSLSPMLAGEAPAGERDLRILAGVSFESPLELELRGVTRSGSSLFLRYGVSARERVSRATIASSSLAS